MLILLVSWRQFEGTLVERVIRTQFFHRVANLNRRNNTIESLLIDYSVSLCTTKIREHIL
jgi:hypothetical protein